MLYVGAGVGASNVGNSYDYGYYGGYHDDDVAWKAIVGIRPVPFVGAEAQWIDFGSGHGDNGYYGFGDYYANSISHPKAAVLYGVGYLPLPLPFLDVYGKAGVARLQTDLTTYQYTGGGYCPPPYSRVQRADGVPHRPVEYQIRVGRGRGDALAGFRFPRGVRAHRLAVRQSLGIHGERHLDVLI